MTIYRNSKQNLVFFSDVVYLIVLSEIRERRSPIISWLTLWGGVDIAPESWGSNIRDILLCFIYLDWAAKYGPRLQQQRLVHTALVRGARNTINMEN